MLPLIFFFSLCNAVSAADLHDSSPCSLVWPKFGDVYSQAEMVYFMFFCKLSPEQASKLRDNGNILTIQWTSLSYDLNTGDFLFHKAGTQDVYKNPSSGTITQDFKFSLFKGNENVESMKFVVKLYIQDLFIDSMNTIVVPLSDPFLHILNRGNDVEGDECKYSHVDEMCTNVDRDEKQLRHFDFIEIGTSGFETLIEAARDDLIGLSVEPLKHLQDTLPDRANVTKLSCAIGDTPGWRDIYYLPNALMEFNSYKLKEHSEGQFLYGLGRVGELNQDIMGRLSQTGLMHPYVLHAKRSIVRMKTVGQIFIENAVSGVTFLKLDCEGFDYKILNAAFDFFERRRFNLPLFIEFENNSNLRDGGLLSSKLVALGYDVYSFFYDVSKIAHDSSVNSAHAVVFAELKSIERDSTNIAREKAVYNLLPLDLLRGRELCRSHHQRIKAERVDSSFIIIDSETDRNNLRNVDPDLLFLNQAKFCSILLSKSGDVLSVNESFSILDDE